MAFPPATIQTNITDATDQGPGTHANLHNQTAAAVNDTVAYAQALKNYADQIDDKVDATNAAVADLDGRLGAAEADINGHEATIDKLFGATERSGIIRGRTNIDAVVNGGSVRYTQAIYDDFTIVDIGDGSGFRSGTGVYAVAASTVADAGADLTCYLNIGSRSVAVGSRIPDDKTTYLTWTGRVLASEVISIHVSMPVPRAVVGGRLEIWRVGIADPMS